MTRTLAEKEKKKKNKKKAARVDAISIYVAHWLLSGTCCSVRVARQLGVTTICPSLVSKPCVQCHRTQAGVTRNEECQTVTELAYMPLVAFPFLGNRQLSEWHPVSHAWSQPQSSVQLHLEDGLFVMNRAAVQALMHICSVFISYVSQRPIVITWFIQK